jgi:5-methylcytosine-specific restriction endonuclease McrA
MTPWKQWKLDVFKLDLTWPCYYCGRILVRRDASVDHVVPRSRGGVDDASNYVIACRQCNSDKGDRVIGWRPNER